MTELEKLVWAAAFVRAAEKYDSYSMTSELKRIAMAVTDAGGAVAMLRLGFENLEEIKKMSSQLAFHLFEKLNDRKEVGRE